MDINEKRAKRLVIWDKMSGSSQLAVEKAIQIIEMENVKKENFTKEDLMRYSHRACNAIDDGNAEPEYENEAFYEEESDKNHVLEYLMLEYDLGEKQ